MDTICDLSDAISSVTEGFVGLTELQELVEAKVEKNLKSVIKFMRVEGKKSNNDFTLTVGDNGVPSVETREEPKGALGKCFESLKKLIEGIKDLIEKSPELVEQLQTAAESAKDLPDKVQSAAATAGLNPLDTAKAAKSLADNVKYLAGFPNDIKAFIDAVKELVTSLKDAFSGEAEGGEEEKKEGGEKKDLINNNKIFSLSI